MNKLAIAAALVLSGSVTAHAADLVINEPAVVADSILTSGIYVQLLGGVALGGALEHYENGNFDHDHDLEAGWAGSVALGYEFDNGLAVEVDILHTSRLEVGYDDAFSTTSLMAGVKYTVDLTDAVAVYGGVGIGGIWADDRILGERESGLGYQVKLGAELAVTENIAVVGEYRFQNAFSPMPGEDSPDDAALAPIHTVMAGLKLSF
jgi:opacity protein-like surface antigen